MIRETQDEKWINEAVADVVKGDRYSLTHGLLASLLRAMFALTVRLDSLFTRK